MAQYPARAMNLDDVREAGMIALRNVFAWSGNAVMIVTFDAPEEYNGYADFFTVQMSLRGVLLFCPGTARQGRCVTKQSQRDTRLLRSLQWHSF